MCERALPDADRQHPPEGSGLDRERGGRVVPAANLTRSTPQDACRVLGVTDVDLAIPVLSFLFGQAQFEGPVAIISLCRLHQEFYGLPGQESLLRERTVKEALHELGHTFGLVHCSDGSCAMSLSTHIEFVDSKSERYCARCGMQLVQRFARNGGV